MAIKKYLFILITGLAIITGCSSGYVCLDVDRSVFYADTLEYSFEQLVKGGVKICHEGIEYYYKNNDENGKGSFNGFSIPEGLDSTDYGVYKIKINEYSVTVYCNGYLTARCGMTNQNAEIEGLLNREILITTFNR